MKTIITATYAEDFADDLKKVGPEEFVANCREIEDVILANMYRHFPHLNSPLVKSLVVTTEVD